MAQLSNLQCVTGSLPKVIPKVPNIYRTSSKSCKIECQSKHLETSHQNKEQNSSLTSENTTRRAIIGTFTVGILAQIGADASLALNQDELWITGPLPGLAPAKNKIANEETGTRSFLRKGIYMANIGTNGRAFRLKKYAFDLLAMGDLIGQDAWNYIRKYLRLKGTFMYYDFDKVISAAPVSDKQPLTDLANRLFDNFEKLQDAVKQKDLPLTRSCYNDTQVILQEVMDRMA